MLLLAQCLETTGGNGANSAETPQTNTGRGGDPGPNAQIRCNNPNETNPWVCTMCNCFHEARGEGDDARLWVGRVMVTRKGMPNYPNTLCGVVWDPNQFSWTLSAAKRNLVLSPDGSTARSGKADDMRNGYAKCRRTTAATMQLPQRHYASHYHVARGPGRVSVNWRNCRTTANAGVHRFYRTCGRLQEAPDLGIPTSGTATVSTDQPTDWRTYVCSL